MKAAYTLFFLASVLLMVNGLIHIISLQLPLEGLSPEESELFTGLQELNLPSFEGRTFEELNLGVSYGVALITIIVGLQNLLIYKKLPATLFKKIITLNFIGWIIVEAFFIRFVITPPILLWGLAVLLFLAALTTSFSYRPNNI